jgi:hypothetical protein
MNVRREPLEPIPALERFNGVFTKLIKKYDKELRDVDVLILSPIYGLVRAEENIVYKEPVGLSWGALGMSHGEIAEMRESNLINLRKRLGRRHYDEVYVNVGKSMLELIEGFDTMFRTNVKITYSQGNGIGPKMRHMRDWILSHK